MRCSTVRNRPARRRSGSGCAKTSPTDQLERLESFFDRHSAPVFHEVCPLADLSTPHLLSMRGYEPFEFTSILFLPLVKQPSRSASERIRVREIGPDEREQWAQLVAKGWSEHPELTGVILDLARVTSYRSGGSDFVAELDGRPIATGSVSIVDGVVLLAGASTIPEARKQGAQNALLSARLEVWRRGRLRYRDDGRPARQLIATQCGTQRVPHCIHANEVAQAPLVRFDGSHLHIG